MHNAQFSSRVSLFSACGVFVACTASVSGPSSGGADMGAGSGSGSASNLGQQFDPKVSGNDAGPGSSASDPRMLWCALEYETFAPSYDVGNIGYIYTTFGDVVANGATTPANVAPNPPYQLQVVTNPTPPYNLSFQAALNSLDATGSATANLTYVVLPAPQVTGPNDYLFELGSLIPPQTATDYNGSAQTFDYLRAYCMIQNPSS
jgi:hypothetical protein